MRVEVIKDILATELPLPDSGVDVRVPRWFRAFILEQPGKENALEQVRAVGFRAGTRFIARTEIVDGSPKGIEAALSALLFVAIEHAAEIRDAIARVED